MSNVKTLRTDKHGNIYGGPRTLAQAEQAVRDAQNDHVSHVAAARKVAVMVADAGYTGVAARLRKAYGITE